MTRASQIYNNLLRVEVSRISADMRRILSAERQELGLALASGDETNCRARAIEAWRTARAWGVEV